MSSEELSQLWQAYRNCLVSASLNGYDSYYPAKTVRILDACCASETLRKLFPYISIGRLGIWRVHPNEDGHSDFFWCFHGSEDAYVVSNYADTKKLFFDTPEAAVAFVEQHLYDENPFA
jgi:hypothetical protein